MMQLIFFLLLALFVQSYYALNVTPTPDIESISNDNKIEVLYKHFKEHNNKNNPSILIEISTFTLFKKYLSEEGDLNIINNAVIKYVENIKFCYDTPENAISNTAIVITDMQNAFMSNGPVAVNGAENAIYYINKAKKYHKHSIHSLDTHIGWSDSFGPEPDYITTFPPHAIPGTDDFNEVDGLNTCADLYVGKKDFAITSNPLFKEYLLKNGITKVTFTGVAGDYCVNAGILGVLDDPQLSHVQVALYEPGVKWVFPDSIISQKLILENYFKFKWINDEKELLYFLNN